MPQFSTFRQHLLVMVALLLVTQCSHAFDYEARLQDADQRCRDIPASESRSGLLLNPPGFRSYFVRSACYQRLARDFRAPAFCQRVIQRQSLLHSSWGYSESHCRALVKELIEEDVAYLTAMRESYEAAPVRISDFRLVQNGNRRDYNIEPSLTAGYASGYRFELMLQSHDGSWVTVLSKGIYAGTGREQISLFIRAEELRAAFPAFDETREWPMTAVLTLSTPLGRLQGKWSPAWLADLWPRTDREYRLTRVQQVAPWKPEIPAEFKSPAHQND